MPVLAWIDKFMKLKTRSVVNPDVYLGAKLKQGNWIMMFGSGL